MGPLMACEMPSLWARAPGWRGAWCADGLHCPVAFIVSPEGTRQADSSRVEARAAQAQHGVIDVCCFVFADAGHGCHCARVFSIGRTLHPRRSRGPLSHGPAAQSRRVAEAGRHPQSRRPWRARHRAVLARLRRIQENTGQREPTPAAPAYPRLTRAQNSFPAVEALARTTTPARPASINGESDAQALIPEGACHATRRALRRGVPPQWRPA